jgi:putative ubiquitin-RnfH superfamily antitoxin RatB of RatAB toxin-antitoxin module
MASVEAAALRVEVAYSAAPRQVACCALTLPPGSTVGDALQASGLLARHPRLEAERLRVGVWGRSVGRGEALHDGDRVEVYRPLQVDPKEARRLRQRRQKTGTARG